MYDTCEATAVRLPQTLSLPRQSPSLPAPPSTPLQAKLVGVGDGSAGGIDRQSRGKQGTRGLKLKEDAVAPLSYLLPKVSAEEDAVVTSGDIPRDVMLQR